MATQTTTQCGWAAVLLFCTQSALAGVLSGTVTGNGNPMPNAVVKLLAATDNALITQTTTSNTGTYSLTTTEGTYNLQVEPPSTATGYVNSRVNGLAITGTALTQNVVLITSGTQITGVVRMPDGTPVKGVAVAIVDQAKKISMGSVTTGADGAYSFNVLPNTYYFTLSGASYNTNFAGEPDYFGANYFAPSTIVSGNTTRDLTIPFVWLSGQVTNSQGAPVAGVKLQTSKYSIYGPRDVASGLTPEFYISQQSLASDATGAYRVALFSANGYTMTAVPTATSSLAQTIFSGVNVTANTTKDFTLAEAAKIAGVVRLPDGTPVKGVNVAIYDQAKKVSMGSVTTGTDGTYRLTVLPSTYYFTLSGTAYNTAFVGEPESFGANYFAPNTVVSGTVTKDLTIPFVWVTGKTTDNAGAPVSGVKLQTNKYSISGPRDAASGLTPQYYVYQTAIVSDAAGNYRMALFAANGYAVTAIPAQNTPFAQTLFSGVNITSDVAKDFALSSPNDVSGVVRLPNGAPVQGVSITIYDQAKKVEMGTMTTGVDGAYRFNVVPSTYYFALSAKSYNTDFAGEPETFGAHQFAYNTVVNGHVTKDLVVPFVWVAGKATDSNGVPVAGVRFQTSKYSIYGPRDVAAGMTTEFYVYQESVRSGTAGDYQMALFAANGYIESVIPPTDSGFAPITETLNVASDMRQDVILQYPDVRAPLIIAGPFVTEIGADTATVVWQTDEPTIGSVDGAAGRASETAYTTEHSVVLTGLVAAMPYTVDVTATDRAGNGPTTARADFVTAALPDTTPPLIIAGPIVTTITHNSAVVTWETDEPATTQISGDVDVNLSGLTTLHAVTLTGLAAQQAYSLTVASSDTLGNGPTTAATTFNTTGAPDVIAPVITEGPSFVDVNKDSVMVVWETDEPANSGLSYNDGTAYGVLNDDALTLHHSVLMPRLLADTLYYVTVSSTDAFGNGPSLSNTLTVRTLKTVDTTLPTFSKAPHVCNINHQLIHLCFDTGAPASVVVTYGTSSDALAQTEARAQLIKHHSLPINGLLAGTTYFLRVTIRDVDGREATSDLLEATTTTVGSKAPTFVQAPTITYKTNGQAVVTWETDRPCHALVEYGAGDYGLRASDERPKTRHSLVITHLSSNTAYQFRVTATDVEGLSVERHF